MSRRRKLTSGEGWVFEPAEAEGPEEAASLPPEEQRVRIRTERRKGGKVVTLVEDLVLSREDRKELAKNLKAACGTGGTVREAAVEIQGDHVDAVREWLRARGWGV
jgi:translation initiation factor 1